MMKCRLQKKNLSKEGKTRGSAEVRKSSAETRSKTEKDDGMRKKSKHSKGEDRDQRSKVKRCIVESKKSKAQKKTARGKKSQKRKKTNSTTQDRSKVVSKEYGRLR